jgi:hypothetical protein
MLQLLLVLGLTGVLRWHLIVLWKLRTAGSGKKQQQ